MRPRGHEKGRVENSAHCDDIRLQGREHPTGSKAKYVEVELGEAEGEELLATY